MGGWREAMTAGGIQMHVIRDGAPRGLHAAAPLLFPAGVMQEQCRLDCPTPTLPTHPTPPQTNRPTREVVEVVGEPVGRKLLQQLLHRLCRQQRGSSLVGEQCV